MTTARGVQFPEMDLWEQVPEWVCQYVGGCAGAGAGVPVSMRGGLLMWEVHVECSRWAAWFSWWWALSL